MVTWSHTEIGVFLAVLGMIIYKIWTVWHVSKQAKASKEGKIIFLWGITGMTAFAFAAKIYIGYQMG